MPGHVRHTEFFVRLTIVLVLLVGALIFVCTATAGDDKPKIEFKIKDDKGIYVPGETLRFTFKADKDCYLLVIDHGTDGALVQIFPNDFNKDSFVKRGTTITLPPDKGTYLFRVLGPSGAEKVEAYASTVPFKSLKSLKSAKTKNMGGYYVFDDSKAFLKELDSEMKTALKDKASRGKAEFYVETGEGEQPK